MTEMTPTLPELAAAIRAAPHSGRRRLVALAGAPASGKSTLATRLAAAVSAAGSTAMVVPMDGFHLHNQTLLERGLLDRKGAPETFDIEGFASLLARLRINEEVFFPIFDRSRDIAIAGGGVVNAACDTVIVEGNYLLFDTPDWRPLSALWDFSIQLDVPFDVLKERLVARWLDHGLTQQDAEARATQNDLRNAMLVGRAALPASITVQF